MDLAAPNVLTRALQRCSRDGELILTITDAIHSRWALNLIRNLQLLDLHHALVIVDSSPTCAALRSRLPRLRPACCAYSSYMRSEPELAAGLAAYNVHEQHVYHLVTPAAIERTPVMISLRARACVRSGGSAGTTRQRRWRRATTCSRSTRTFRCEPTRIRCCARCHRRRCKSSRPCLWPQRMRAARGGLLLLACRGRVPMGRAEVS